MSSLSPEVQAKLVDIAWSIAKEQLKAETESKLDEHTKDRLIKLLASAYTELNLALSGKL